MGKKERKCWGLLQLLPALTRSWCWRADMWKFKIQMQPTQGYLSSPLPHGCHWWRKVMYFHEKMSDCLPLWGCLCQFDISLLRQPYGSKAVSKSRAKAWHLWGSGAPRKGMCADRNTASLVWCQPDSLPVLPCGINSRYLTVINIFNTAQGYSSIDLG